MADLPSRRGIVLLLGLWAASVLLPSSPAAGQTSPATGPEVAAATPAGASQPASAPPASQPAGAMEVIEQRLKLTDAQADAYRLAVLRKDRIDDPVALTLFLRKMVNLPKLTPDELDNLDRPAMRNLLTNPQRYAGQPIRLRVLVNRVWKWQPGVDFGATQDWTRGDGPVYQYEGYNAEANQPSDEPICILSPLDPNVVLAGHRSKDGNQGERIYDIPRVQVAGVFFKVFSGRDMAGRSRDYPLIIAWQMRAAPEGGLQIVPESWWQALGIAIALFVGIAAYFFWRLRQAAHRYRTPALAAPVRAEEAQRQEETPPEEDQTDSDLAAAAAEFRKKEAPPQ